MDSSVAALNLGKSDESEHRARMTPVNTNQGYLARITSPQGLALISYAVFLLSWLFPPKLYTHYIDEPDILFLDGASILFYSSCVLFFLLGVRFVERYFPANPTNRFEVNPRISPVLFLLIPVTIALGFSVASSIFVLREYPLVVLALLSQGGEDIKNSELSLHAPFGLADTWLLGIVWWATWRCGQIEMKTGSRRFVKIVLSIAVLSCIFAATLRVSRAGLMLPIAGVAIVHLLNRAQDRDISLGHLFVYGAVFGGCIISVFILFSFIRGGEADSFITDVIGYTLTSYNRLCAVVHHRIRYQYAGRGIYIFNFVAFNNMLNEIIPFREFFKWPDFYDWWQSEFGATWDAGLNGKYIWSGTFGYIFSDLGWISPLWLFVYGLLSGWVWRGIKKGTTAGLVLYPWFGFSILFWFGTNNLVENKVVVFLIEAMLLAGYERLLSSRRPLEVTLGTKCGF